MKKLLLVSSATTLLFCGCGAALASDLGLAPARYDWAGGYVGTNLGAALNTTTVTSAYKYTGTEELEEDEYGPMDELGFTDTADDAWFTAGILAGYNWQYGNFVIGAEADINYLGFNQTVRHDATDAVSSVLAQDPTIATDKVEYTVDWFGTFRARLGYAVDNVLIYGTGGLAYGQMKVHQLLDAANADGDAVRWDSNGKILNAGWTVGGGIEYAYDRWVLGAEYLYVDLGTFDWGGYGTVDVDQQEIWSQVKRESRADATFSLARATVKYRF
jgi:outer membrane immunogenic protein